MEKVHECVECNGQSYGGPCLPVVRPFYSHHMHMCVTKATNLGRSVPREEGK